MPHVRPFIRALCGALVALALLAAPPADAARGNSGTAALQVGLEARGLYGGTIHGRFTAQTRAAVRALQRRNGLSADGVPRRSTRAALGRYGRYTLGRRALRRGMHGWDVASLQFLLAWHGFPSGTLDGHLGPRTDTALRRYQAWRRLGADGIAGPATVGALRGERPPVAPIRLRRPVSAPVGDRFGPRGSRFHAGLDFSSRHGARVVASRAGVVVSAGWDPGGFGNLVVLGHGAGVRTWYAHLARVRVRKGQRVASGQPLGAVGTTGYSTGPHLHLELRVRGALVNPLPALR